MKQFILLLLLCLSFSVKAQYYVLYDCKTKAEIEAVMEQPADTTVCYTTVVRTVNICCPKFNEQTQQWYNDATPEQEAEYQANKGSDFLPCEAVSSVNSVLITPQTDAQLNARHPCQGNGFTLFCPKIPYGTFANSFTAYVKIIISGTVSWGKFLVIKNQ